MLAVQFLQIIAMPIFLANYPWIMAPIILFLIPLNTPFWSLIHEAVHKNLHHKAPINDALARLMSVVFGASFDVLRFGHLMHHQYN
ncbi:MAG TPA: fatty acid desaturase, partial [Alphaproteobacteria bacterium]